MAICASFFWASTGFYSIPQSSIAFCPRFHAFLRDSLVIHRVPWHSNSFHRIPQHSLLDPMVPHGSQSTNSQAGDIGGIETSPCTNNPRDIGDISPYKQLSALVLWYVVSSMTLCPRCDTDLVLWYVVPHFVPDVTYLT